MSKIEDWIPVDKSLPKSEGLYLVTTTIYRDVNYPTHQFTDLAYFRKGRWFYKKYDSGQIEAGVIAWCQVPPPFQSNEKTEFSVE